MKLKKWLILSHLTVMLAPILTSILLYNLISSYHKKVELNDYINALARFKVYEEKLNNPKLYTDFTMKNIILNIEDKNTIQISMYNSNGQKLYSSEDGIIYTKSKEDLYSNLYKMTTGYKSYTLKKPVLNEDVLVGFYEITIARQNFIEGVNIKTIIAAVCFVITLTAVFIIIIILLNKKFNKPINLLVDGMSKFVEGDKSYIKYENKDEIGELITHFNIMKNDLEEKRKTIELEQKSKEYMISAISHDLKTPLTSIRAYAESMYNDTDLNISKIKSRSAVILNKSDYMKKMIDDLMIYTLLTSDYKMDFVEVEGNEFFEMLFSGYNKTCEENNINLHVEICIQGIYQVDVTQMMRVVDNLITNAIRYTPVKGHIWIAVFSLDKTFPEWLESEFKDELKLWKNSGCIIIVKNEGSSIQKEELEKIFMPFYQTDDSRNKTSQSGVGLGLSIVNLVLQKHGGELKVFSEKNITTFACWIPQTL